jgi:hypothetical protein
MSIPGLLVWAAARYTQRVSDATDSPASVDARPATR